MSTTTLVHHSPLGDLMIPGVIGVVPPDTPFEVDDELAATLLSQDALYSAVGTPSPHQKESVPELREALAARGLPTEGKRAELVARLTDDDAGRAAGSNQGADQ